MKPLINTAFAILLSSAALFAQGKKPLKVFILSGQSNMVGTGSVGTFPAIGLDPATAPMLKDMQTENGEPVVCDEVYIACASPEKQGKLTVGYGAPKGEPKIGPEYTFGIYMHKALGEPILIIKAAWGGKDLMTQFRPPSAGPSLYPADYLAAMKASGKDVEAAVAKRNEQTGLYYRMMMEHVHKVLKDPKAVYPDYDAGAGYEIAGFVWFQGYNDWISGRNYPVRDGARDYSEYTRLLGCFIRDIRKELNAPKMPFVTGVFGMDGKDAAQSIKEFRKAQAAVAEMPEFKGNVVNVHTVEFWDDKLTELLARRNALMKGEVKLEGELAEIMENYKVSYENRLSKDSAVRKKSFYDRRKYTGELVRAYFPPEDAELLRVGASNQSYHYWGSAKFYGQAGKAFAEALVEMRKTNQ